MFNHLTLFLIFMVDSYHMWYLLKDVIHLAFSFFFFFFFFFCKRLANCCFSPPSSLFFKRIFKIYSLAIIMI
uniref:Uncharacterized protein n=1 Tax=Octopus bimaculoides TaxID=37653 RepID=A0A0L8HF51_OCTBM